MNSKIQVKSVTLIGDGQFYKNMYSSSIRFHRMKTLIHHAHLSYMGVKGYPCVQDCGPNGSCRCGMCVKGDNSNNCDLPNCQECDYNIYQSFLLFSFIFVTVWFHLFFAILMMLVNGADFRKEALFQILGCNCCLCHPDNFKKRHTPFRNRLFRLCMKWPLFKLPPFYLFLMCVIILSITYYNFNKVFEKSLNTVSMAMDEEYYPSDHLMVTAVIAI